MKLDDLIHARENLEAQLQFREEVCEEYGHEEDVIKAEEIRFQVQSIRWAERVCRAAIVIEEERTPDGVSETLVDELVKAVRG